jgi:hypothetical protein
MAQVMMTCPYVIAAPAALLLPFRLARDGSGHCRRPAGCSALGLVLQVHSRLPGNVRWVLHMEGSPAPTSSC